MALGLRIELEEIEGRVILRLDGRLDAAGAPMLERKLSSLIEEGRIKLLLDFSKVDYLSSAGMRTLLSASKKVKAEKGLMVLFAVDEEVGEIIKMAGFERILHICSSEQEALQFHK